MSFESYIAKRYFGSGRFFVSFSTWITILGVTLGVAVICFVMSMANGFEREIRSRLLGTMSHITIFPLGEQFITEYQDMVDQMEALPDVEAASAFIYYKAAVSSASAGDGIVVRGVDPAQERRAAKIAENIKVGAYNLETTFTLDDTLPGILLGKGLASRLGVFIDDPVVLYSLRGEDLRKGVRPRVAKFNVNGIFETGMYEFDGQLAYITITEAQKLFRTGDVATAVHLRLSDIYLAETVGPMIDSALGFEYDIVPWNVLHKNLFSWIKIEKIMLFLGFSLIVLVAAFSIVSTLVMLTMEKRGEIGILKTIGATPAAVRKIFVYKGLAIGLIGVSTGWILALAAGAVQNQWHIVSLPPDIYFISYLPIDAHLLDFMIAGGVTFFICFLAALYPAHQASRLSVVEVLRE